MKSGMLAWVGVVLWGLRRAAFYLGWVPLLGVLGLLMASVWLAQAEAESQAAFTSLQAEVRQLAKRPLPPPRPVAPVVVVAAVKDPSEQWQALWQGLPAFAELSPRMMQIARLAEQRQIALDIGDYQWQAKPTRGEAAGLQQFDMRFTISSDYLRCRQFVRDVLQAYPTMALTGLELRKNETAQSAVDATLTFSVFIHEGAGHGV